MATSTTSRSTAPVDAEGGPGVVADTVAWGIIEPTAEERRIILEALRAASRPIPWQMLATIKLLAPEASQRVKITGLPAATTILKQVERKLLERYR